MIEFLTNFGDVLWALKWWIGFVVVFFGIAFLAERHGPIDEDQIAP